MRDRLVLITAHQGDVERHKAAVVEAGGELADDPRPEWERDAASFVALIPAAAQEGFWRRYERALDRLLGGGGGCGT